MDNTLLQTDRIPANSEAEHVEEGRVAEFRDFQIAQPQLPWRMRLDPPIEYDGQKYDQLIFDFDAMTAKDFIRASREFTHVYKPERDEIPFPDTNPLYWAIIAAHRANVPRGVIERLPSRYWTPLRSQILKVCGGSPEEPKA